MSQAKIYYLLQKKKKPLTLREICNELNLAGDLVNKRLAIMIEHNEIAYKEISGSIAWEKYKVKRRMRLYYIK